MKPLAYILLSIVLWPFAIVLLAIAFIVISVGFPAITTIATIENEKEKKRRKENES